jgi:hypothetical protein
MRCERFGHSSKVSRRKALPRGKLCAEPTPSRVSFSAARAIEAAAETTDACVADQKNVSTTSVTR